jgi:NAD(P)H-dependent FMN reductase
MSTRLTKETLSDIVSGSFKAALDTLTRQTWRDEPCMAMVEG